VLWFSARETVDIETPANLAISSICNLPSGGYLGVEGVGATAIRGLVFMRFGLPASGTTS
jgi:hypothetical protein